MLAAVAALTACAGAPTSVANDVNQSDCADVRTLRAGQLYGTWELELTALNQRGQLTLRQHPEFSESLRGEFRYGDQRSIASGDVEAGEFNLDESLDGKSLHAFWSGKLTPSACGAEIRGTWQTLAQPGKPAQESPFVLRRGGH
ncbi:hypothetical protein [Ottowia flava]|uniref:hypothetical protein n=1 Tax=Ottowia sp. GY511 TaxID=2603274 RepID=UPI00164F4CDE|nr:hypothetical protein [Ottowia sp. GY511]